jgi:hypothetical protein
LICRAESINFTHWHPFRHSGPNKKNAEAYSAAGHTCSEDFDSGMTAKEEPTKKTTASAGGTTILPQKKSAAADNPDGATAEDQQPQAKRIKTNPDPTVTNASTQDNPKSPDPKSKINATKKANANTTPIAKELMNTYRSAMGASSMATSSSGAVVAETNEGSVDIATKNAMVSKALNAVLGGGTDGDNNNNNDQDEVMAEEDDEEEEQEEPLEVQPFDVLVSLAQTMAVSKHAGNKLLMTFCYQAAPHFSKVHDPKQKFAMAEQLLKKMQTDLGTRFLWDSSHLPTPLELAMTATCILIELMPTPHDVVFTHDGSQLVPEHAGNEFFIMLCQALLIRMDDPATTVNFNTFIKSEMEKLSPPGRFLLADQTEFKFTEITDEDQLQSILLRRILEEDRNNYRRSVEPPPVARQRVVYHNDDEDPSMDDNDEAADDEDLSEDEEYRPKSRSKKRRTSLPTKIQPGSNKASSSNNNNNNNNESEDLVKRRQRRVRLSEVTHKQYMKSLQQNNAATVEINIPELKEGSDSVATKRFKVLRKYHTKGKPIIITPEDAAHLIKTAEDYVDPKKGSSKRKAPAAIEKGKTELKSAMKSSGKAASKNDKEEAKKTAATPKAAADDKPDKIEMASKATTVDKKEDSKKEEEAKQVVPANKSTKETTTAEDEGKSDKVQPSKSADE